MIQKKKIVHVGYYHFHYINFIRFIIVYMDNDLKLLTSFTCWVQVLDSTKEYNSTLQKAFTFSTIKEFWTFYQHMHRPQKLTIKDNIYIFKDGIFPTW